jgi:hypothetical protein
VIVSRARDALRVERPIGNAIADIGDWMIRKLSNKIDSDLGNGLTDFDHCDIDLMLRICKVHIECSQRGLES